jgi:hypothetical protein
MATALLSQIAFAMFSSVARAVFLAPEAVLPRGTVVESTATSWPEPLADAAYCGLIGDIVKVIERDTESDPAAILLQGIVAFGAVIGRGPHVRVEGDEHHLNLFALLAGATSKSRKGTSFSRVREIFSCLTPSVNRPPSACWPRVVNGLSSGEGLKYNVRDARLEFKRNKNTGGVEENLVDAGVEDKRLLVVEPEFAQVLRQGARAGNTLSATIRCAWDTGDLMTLTKNDPVIATGAHISIIGHITIDELQAELTATESANGFANRFLLMCVKRSRTLPFGGAPLSRETLTALVTRISAAVEHARQVRAVQMTKAARQVWERVYPRLSEGYPGLLGAVTARAEAQCIRLSLAYALADQSREIDAPHLHAAIAVWERCEASARYVFGDTLGDRVADEILRSLRAAGAAGMTRTEISALFKGHESADRIGAALQRLRELHVAASHQRHGPGRSTEIWCAACCGKSGLSETRGAS